MAQAHFSATKVHNGKLEIGLSGQIVLKLVLESPRLSEVKAGERVIAGGIWEVTEVTPARMYNPGEPDQRWEQVLRLEPMVPGEHKLLLAPLEYQEQDGSWEQIEWQEVPVLVTTKINKADPSQMQGPPDIEHLPARDTGSPWTIVFIAAGISLLLLLALGVWLLRRRKVPAPAAPPEQTALQELKQLQAGLPSSLEESNHFHTRLAGVLREYLEARFQIPASRQTSEEYSEKLAQAGHLTPEQLQLFRELLQRCDLPRFAPLRPAPEECLQTLELARTFIEQGSEGDQVKG